MLKRLTAVALLLKEVSAQSARETSIRHGHISTLHIWWARRPLPTGVMTAGDVLSMRNEWIKSQRSGEQYRPCVPVDCKSKRGLYLTQNPPQVDRERRSQRESLRASLG
jgi:hypothetical protein